MFSRVHGSRNTTALRPRKSSLADLVAICCKHFGLVISSLVGPPLPEASRRCELLLFFFLCCCFANVDMMNWLINNDKIELNMGAVDRLSNYWF